MIQVTIDRLRAHACPPLRTIEGAEELAALAVGVAPNHGAAFVAPFEERAEPNELATGAFRQRVSVTLLVAVVLRRQDDARGAKRIGSIDVLQPAIESALAGWTPDQDDHDPYELVTSRAAPAANGVTWFVTTWRTSRWLERS